MCSVIDNIERQKFSDYYDSCCTLVRFQLEFGEVTQAAFAVWLATINSSKTPLSSMCKWFSQMR